MLDMSGSCRFSLPKDKKNFHPPIVIVAIMSNAILPNARSPLSSKLQAPHLFCLLPFNEMGLRGMARVILA
jgi:hypothetical protein